MGRRTPIAVESHLRQVRERRGLAQVELARLVGLSRQALSAIESGRYVPNTAVALRLARILGCAVEDLFAPREEAAVEARLAGEPGAAGRVRIGQVRGTLVAWPLTGSEFPSPADGTVLARTRRGVRVRLLPPVLQPDRVVFVAGCDPALRIAAQLAERQRSLRVHWIPLSSLRALRAVRQGWAHLAGTHLHPPEDPEGARTLRGILGRTPVTVLTVARWEEGLMIRPGLARRVQTPEDLLRPGMRVVNRDPGSGTRLVFDRWLRAAGIEPARIRGYAQELPDHLAVAEAVVAGFADLGPGVLPVARAYGLAFLPIVEQRYDLVVPQDLLDFEPVRVFVDVLTERTFRRELATLGYDPAPAGETRTVG